MSNGFLRKTIDICPNLLYNTTTLSAKQRRIKMPSNYAHYLFGCKVLDALPDATRKIIAQNHQLFDIGIHGPDILFYYKPLKKNAVSKLGFAMHDLPAKRFFTAAKQAIAKEENQNAALAYALGFVCHFALDRACHGYIEKKLSVSAISHTALETEFDRFLMCNEGKNPVKIPSAIHVIPSKENAQIIAPFFAPITKKQALTALKSVRFYNKLLLCNNPVKGGIIDIALTLCGKHGFIHGMLVTGKPLPDCEDSNLRLRDLLNESVDECIRLISDFLDYINKDTPLCSAFYDTFEKQEGWQNIPLSSK